MLRQQGFTLIELLTVMIIVGILAVVAIPRTGDGTAFREVGFRDGVAATIGYARRMAVASRHFVCVNVDGGGGQVTLSRDPAMPENVAAINCTVPLVPPTAQPGCAAAVCAPDGVTLNGGAALLLFFDPQGRLVLQNTPLLLAADVNIPINGENVNITAATGNVQ